MIRVKPIGDTIGALASVLRLGWLRQSDKLKHLIAGLIVTLLSGYVNPWVGFAAAIVVGGLKEAVWDYLTGKGSPEWKDFFATCLGGLIGLIGIGVVLLFK